MSETPIAVIGTIDSSGGAGINQDIRVAALFGYSPQVCVANISLQSSRGVEYIHPLEEDVFEANLRAVLHSNDLRYVKIGALNTVEQIRLLTKYLARTRAYKVILDPVIRASRGKAFLDEAGISELKKLIRQVDYLSPNLPELEMLCGKQAMDFRVAKELARSYAGELGLSILLKGGHIDAEDIEEAFVSPDAILSFGHPRRNWQYSHGTGCALAMAFCCYLQQGIADTEAFQKASRWVLGFYDKLNGIAESCC